jgi:hypothetical protein
MVLSRMQCCLVAALCTLSASLCGAQQNVNGAHFASFQVSEGYQTFPMSVNNSLTVTGYFIDQAGATGGFIRNAAGEVTTVSVAGSALTFPVAINAAGEIAGSTVDSHGNSSGFVRYVNGSIATFDPGGTHPGATVVTGINNEGTVVGSYELTNTVFPQHGFLRRVNGTITTFDVPGSDRTEPVGINAAGEIAGIYWFNKNIQAGGFVRSAEGAITTYPGVPVSINAEGYVAGWYAPLSEVDLGFVRFPQGAISSFAPPAGTLVAPYMGINEVGTTFGNYSVVGPVSGASRVTTYQVFVRTANGAMTSFGFPGSSSTTATSMNDSDVITGSYTQGKNSFGFVRIPGAAQDQ